MHPLVVLRPLFTSRFTLCIRMPQAQHDLGTRAHVIRQFFFSKIPKLHHSHCRAERFIVTRDNLVEWRLNPCISLLITLGLAELFPPVSSVTRQKEKKKTFDGLYNETCLNLLSIRIFSRAAAFESIDVRTFTNHMSTQARKKWGQPAFSALTIPSSIHWKQ